MSLTQEEKAKALEAVKGLEITEEKKKAYETDDVTLEVLYHQIETKRKANEEAKQYRERLEAIDKEKKKADEDKKAKESDDLKKKGEFEKLLKDRDAEVEKLKADHRELVIRKEIELLAVQRGIKKREYIGLLKTSDLSVDDDGAVEGLEKRFEDFEKENPDLFGEPKKSGVDKKKPAGGQVDDAELDKLKAAAQKSGKTEDIARYQQAVKDRSKK